MAPFVGEFGDRLGGPLDAGHVGDLAVFRRNIEVDAEQYAFALHVGLIECAEPRHDVHLDANGAMRRSAPARPERKVSVAASMRARTRGLRRTHRRDDAVSQISFASATAVSDMRFEKPHSLSYHDMMRTRLPSMTLVWSMWKIEERGSWLKSIETLGLSV